METKRTYKCWNCKQTSPEDSFFLAYGKTGERKILGYFCSKDCVAKWMNDNWENL